MVTKVFHYPNCSTCRKALKWLDARGVAYEAVDIVAAPPTMSELQRALKAGVPLKRLFNTSGQSYRDGGWGRKIDGIGEAEALAALTADGKLIKRPFVLAGEGILVSGESRAVQFTEQFLLDEDDARFGARLEGHVRAAGARGRAALEQQINADVPGEVLCRSFGRLSRAVAAALHVALPVSRSVQAVPIRSRDLIARRSSMAR